MHLHHGLLLRPVFRLVCVFAALGLLVRRRRPAALLFGASARAGDEPREGNPAHHHGQKNPDAIVHGASVTRPARAL